MKNEEELFMKYFQLSIVTMFALLFFQGCSKSPEKAAKKQSFKIVIDKDNLVSKVKGLGLSALPGEVKWITNETDPEWSSPRAKKGGTYVTYMMTFPLTLRTVGPDSNGGFAAYMRGLNMGLVDIHPNTLNTIPALATHWYLGKDHKTVYYKLNQSARWSDGTPITADDYLFTFDFMRSKHILAPWYNNYYNEYLDKVVKYDDYTIAVVGKKKKSDREMTIYYNVPPTPRHFYGKLDKDFVKKYQWKVVPVPGPYNVSEMRKGKYVAFKRIADWWAKDLRYYRNRFNVDRVKVKVIRDINVAYEHFKKGEIENFHLTIPDLWYKKSKGKIYDQGQVKKLWFFTDSPQSPMGLYLNTDYWLLKDINVRKGLAHAMNVDKVIKTVLRGDYERLHSVGEGTGKYSNTTIRAREFSLKKAGQYFDRAGWTKRGKDGIRINKAGKRLSLVVTYGNAPHEQRLVILKEEAKKAGLELQLKLMDGATAFKSILEKQHQIAWMGWSTSVIPSYWQGYHSDNAHRSQTNNITNTDNKELDKLIMEYRNEFNDEKKQALSRKIQKFIHDLCVFVPTFKIPYFRLAYWSYWQLPEVPATKTSRGAFEPFGIKGGLFWLDKGLKKEIKKGKTGAPSVIVDKTYKI